MSIKQIITLPNMRYIFTTTAWLFFFLWSPSSAMAQSGTLDLSFDTNGIVTTPIGTSDDFGRAIVLQPDGHLVAAGYSDNGSQDVFALARYTSNGSLDNTFGTNGLVTTALNNSGDRAHALAIQNDGKLLAAGYSQVSGNGPDFAVARYNANGSLDNTFSDDGKTAIGFGATSNDRAFSIAIQNDGKIVVAGYNTNLETQERDFAAVRLNTDGTLDNTFGTSGTFSLSLAIGVDEVRTVLIQNDGKIILAGYCFDYVQRLFAAIRLNPNGTLDNTFGNSGIVRTPVQTTDDAAYAAALQADGKIILAGYSYSAKYDFALVRYNTDGSLDNSFDNDGMLITTIGVAEDVPYALAVQPDGKIIAAGQSQSGYNNFALVRYNTNGSLDTSFGAYGIVTTPIGNDDSDDIIKSIALQPDGKILVAGQTSNNEVYDFALARYNASGANEILNTENGLEKITVYPNPFSSNCTVQLNNAGTNTTLQLYNHLGQHINQWTNTSGEYITIQRDQLPSGIYCLQLISNSQTVAIEKIVITDAH